MGHSYTVLCKKCGTQFKVNEGGGFCFHLLHCNRCGADKSIGFDELGEVHFRYLKGLPGPYAIATAGSDRRIQEEYQGTALPEAEYNKEVEKLAGQCECGGAFTFKARARCPECRSARYSKVRDGNSMCYD